MSSWSIAELVGRRLWWSGKRRRFGRFAFDFLLPYDGKLLGEHGDFQFGKSGLDADDSVVNGFVDEHVGDVDAEVRVAEILRPQRRGVARRWREVFKQLDKACAGLQHDRARRRAL